MTKNIIISKEIVRTHMARCISAGFRIDEAGLSCNRPQKNGSANE